MCSRATSPLSSESGRARGTCCSNLLESQMSATGEHVLPSGHSTVTMQKLSKNTPLIDDLSFKDGDFPWLIVWNYQIGHLLIYPMSTMSTMSWVQNAQCLASRHIAISASHPPAVPAEIQKDLSHNWGLPFCLNGTFDGNYGISVCSRGFYHFRIF